MHAAVALLDEHGAGQVERLWDLLGERLGLHGVRHTPIPHLSWDVFGAMDEARLEALLARRAEGLAPFDLRLSGLGLFPGAGATLYLAVQKDAALLELHGSLHEDLAAAAAERSPLYAPARWVPHVTLVHHDPQPGPLGQAVSELLASDLPDRLWVAALGWIRQPPGEAGSLAARFELGGA